MTFYSIQASKKTVIFSCTLSFLHLGILDVGRIEHDANGRTERLRGKGALELGTDLTGGTVGTSDLTPDGTSGGTVDGLLTLVDVSNTLAEVRLGFLVSGNVFQFQDGSGGGLSMLSTAISQVTSLQIESARGSGEKGMIFEEIQKR